MHPFVDVLIWVSLVEQISSWYRCPDGHWLTGDNIDIAKAIAKEYGILTEGELAIEGPDFQTKIKEELDEIAPRIQVLNRGWKLGWQGNGSKC